jgi:hypothetical protein
LRAEGFACSLSHALTLSLAHFHSLTRPLSQEGFACVSPFAEELRAVKLALEAATPYTLNPQPKTLNPKLQTLNSKP